MDEYDIDLHLETSARTGDNVEKLFVEAAKLLYSQHLKNKGRFSTSDSFANSTPRYSNQSLPLDDIYEEKNKRKNGCC